MIPGMPMGPMVPILPMNRLPILTYPRPSIRPYPSFNAIADAEVLRRAMKGLGCDNSQVIAVICARSCFQRQQIRIAFKASFGRDLLKDLKSELYGNFENLILALMEHPARFDAMELRHAMEIVGTRESVLIEIMCTRTNAQIMMLKQTYRQMYGRDLETDLISETSGWFKRLLVSLCRGGRDESQIVNSLAATQDARRLYQAGVARFGTDEECFNAILCTRNYAQLRYIFLEYRKLAGHSLEDAIRSEFSGDIRRGLLAILAFVQNRSGYFARLLYDTMHGLGTNDRDLIRLVVSRSEIDLMDIRCAFFSMFNRTLESMIQDDTSGSYRDGLLAVVKGNY